MSAISFNFTKRLPNTILKIGFVFSGVPNLIQTFQAFSIIDVHMFKLRKTAGKWLFFLTE